MSFRLKKTYLGHLHQITNALKSIQMKISSILLTTNLSFHYQVKPNKDLISLSKEDETKDTSTSLSGGICTSTVDWC